MSVASVLYRIFVITRFKLDFKKLKLDELIKNVAINTATEFKSNRNSFHQVMTSKCKLAPLNFCHNSSQRVFFSTETLSPG